MKKKVVSKECRLPADIDTVFSLLTDLKTLQYIAAPYASFGPVNGAETMKWLKGRTFSFQFRLFGVIPFGIHTIEVIRFSRDEIYTLESNRHVPIWNHRIVLKDNGDGTTGYRDEVEIGAGWKTWFVWLWAHCFYSHRQRKWLRLLKKYRTNDEDRK